MWTTPPSRFAACGLAAIGAAVAVVAALVLVAWVRGDLFGQRCRVAGHSLTGEGLQRCLAELADGKEPVPIRSADSVAASVAGAHR